MTLHLPGEVDLRPGRLPKALSRVRFCLPEPAFQVHYASGGCIWTDASGCDLSAPRFDGI